MRPFSIVGLILIVLGVLAFAVRSVTYFTTEHVTGPLGFLAASPMASAVLSCVNLFMSPSTPILVRWSRACSATSSPTRRACD